MKNHLQHTAASGAVMNEEVTQSSYIQIDNNSDQAAFHLGNTVAHPPCTVPIGSRL